jgi:hypothetical protein
MAYPVVFIALFLGVSIKQSVPDVLGEMLKQSNVCDR